ncbi:choice-of-anchor J family PEP-CTERM protein [Massilia endophytica]|uniref:choice-of-anchor J family PEP-CTERM protein n=1 Tax=Massilia endophytica TaxID=2899220 RepID=UPI001E459B65|nr:choice-of-anchor J domain-containing protein [Massilia endophytica]UGQ48678.1 choice-of-anchor J domain-containing protein [Massilia endophytica]
MKTFLSLFASAALTISASAYADAPPSSLSEGFDNVAGLSGWALYNGDPAGESWFQGNSGIFNAAAGAANSYIAANFLSASMSSTVVDNWLITPEFTVNGTAQLRFLTRNSAEQGFNDTLHVMFGAGGGTDVSGFTTTLLTVGGGSTYPGGWTEYVANVSGSGTGRFAFHYAGLAENASYIGIDSVSIAAVPEPTSWLMLGVGLAGLGLLRRKGRRVAGAGIALAALGMSQGAMAAGPQQHGMVVVKDAETGKLRAPTDAEFRQLVPQQVPESAFSAGGTGKAPEVKVNARGMRFANVENQAVFSVVQANADGSLSEACVVGEKAATEFVNKRASKAQAKEARYEAQ